MSEPTEQIIDNLRRFIEWYGCDPGVPMSAVDVADDAAKRLAELLAERDALAVEVKALRTALGRIALDFNLGSANHALGALMVDLTPEQAEACIAAAQDDDRRG
jgi:hypothetical protein